MAQIDGNISLDSHPGLCKKHSLDMQGTEEGDFGRGLLECYECKTEKNIIRRRPESNFWTRRADIQTEWIAQMLERQQMLRVQRTKDNEKNDIERAEYERILAESRLKSKLIITDAML